MAEVEIQSRPFVTLMQLEPGTLCTINYGGKDFVCVRTQNSQFYGKDNKQREPVTVFAWIIETGEPVFVKYDKFNILEKGSVVRITQT